MRIFRYHKKDRSPERALRKRNHMDLLGNYTEMLPQDQAGARLSDYCLDNCSRSTKTNKWLEWRQW